MTVPPDEECSDKMIASGFVTSDVTIRHKEDLAGGATDGRMRSKHQRMPKMNSFTTEDLDIFQSKSFC